MHSPTDLTAGLLLCALASPLRAPLRHGPNSGYGLLVVLYARPPGVRYFGLFVAAFGTQANVPATLVYGQNQTAKIEKKAVVAAVMISVGSVGGICGSTIFRTQDAPIYFPGMWATIAMHLLNSMLTCCMSMYFKGMNKLADEGNKPALEGVEDSRTTLESLCRTIKMLTKMLVFVTLLPLLSATPSPAPTTALEGDLIERQATSRTTFFGTCHTSTPTDNIPRGICTITSPTDTPFTTLGCNNGILDAPRLPNCTFDGSPCSARPPTIIGGPLFC
ncbi:hypothetical protein BU23DRAFT_574313 [Bimuria novae-zelandiae CBS 107.79]|uniref:MFS general substrate transporter n=1 Tax=Bimuria novae-zelandiae CBS 107.79 TaxID=1447943 RepID=A0A6A5UYA8_9PLEO|nr:hypothetical protein BU23DRAFT_574313 [Bimuria novae-zelandiae CBS 107.79]